MDKRIPKALRKAVKDAFKGIPGVGKADITYDGVDQLAVVVPGWSPTFHERDLLIGLDVERLAVGVPGITCRHDGTPVKLNQQALIDVVERYAIEFAAAQREIAAAAAAAGVTAPIEHERRGSKIGHLAMNRDRLDELVEEMGDEHAANHIAWVHGELMRYDGWDAVADGGEYDTKPAMDPGEIAQDEIGYGIVSGRLALQDGMPVFEITPEQSDGIHDMEIGPVEGRVRLGDHPVLGGFFPKPRVFAAQAVG